MSYRFEERSQSDASVEKVFEVLVDAPRWREWAGPLVRRSGFEREGTPPPGGVGSIRKVGMPPVVAREECVVYEPPRAYSYVLRSGMPVKDYRADVTLIPSGSGTEIVWRGEFTPRIPGTGLALRAFLRVTVGRLARGLAGYAARSR